MKVFALFDGKYRGVFGRARGNAQFTEKIEEFGAGRMGRCCHVGQGVSGDVGFIFGCQRSQTSGKRKSVRAREHVSAIPPLAMVAAFGHTPCRGSLIDWRDVPQDLDAGVAQG